MNEQKRRYYQTELIKINRGNSRGIFINAKPLYILSLIECIDQRLFTENRFIFPLPEVEAIYVNICKIFEPNRCVTPFILPFYHMSKESFYHIKWKGVQFTPSQHAHSPSAKILKENVSYAYLDEALWDLLQDFSVREHYKELIVNFYLKPKTEE